MANPAMNSATDVASGAALPAREGDFVPIGAGRCWLAGTALFALPLAQWWRLTEDADAVVAFTALVVAFGWWVARALQSHAPRTTVTAALAGLGLLAFGTWLLAWVHVEDFWVLRWSWCVLAVAATLVLWGWSGPLRALRPLLAFVVWAVLPPGALPFVESPGWLCEATATVAGWGLWLQHDGAYVHGATIHLPTGSVLVGGGCTVVPLWVSLAHLFVPAWLIFQLAWRRALLVIAAAGAFAAVLSIVRVMIMAMVVADPVRFHYWHGPTGASWFTAAGMLAMAWLIDRAMRDGEARSEPILAARGQVWTLGGIIGVSVVAAALGFLRGEETFAPSEAAAPGVPHFTLTFAGGRQFPRWRLAHARFGFAWERRAKYDAALSGEKLEVRLCYAPRLLTGDPVAAALPYGWLPHTPGAGWEEVSAGEIGPVRELASRGRCTWIATLPVGERLVANEAQWQALGAARLRQPATWLRWLAGRAPLRDKRAHWIEVTWAGPGAPPLEEMRAAVASWCTLAQESTR